MKSMKNSKKLKSVSALALCGVMSFGAVASGGGGGGGTSSSADAGKTTVLTMLVGENAYGTDILKEQAERFSAKYAEKSYATGKKGVAVQVETSGAAINIDESMLNEGYHIIATGDGYRRSKVT